MKHNEITLAQFVYTEIENLKKFQEMWETNYSKNPKNWPISNGKADWFEHYSLFVEQGHKA